MSGGHSGEAIPVPIPNTEVKLSNADDTAFVVGKQVAARLFFSFNNFHGLAATYGVKSIDGLRVRKKVNPKKSYCRMIFFNGFAIEHKLPDFFLFNENLQWWESEDASRKAKLRQQFQQTRQATKVASGSCQTFFSFNIFIYVAGSFCFTSGAKPCITATSLYPKLQLIFSVSLAC